jgi:catechol 2,3-dioxygenase-like lactoylglutathione lyase family enzyme
MGTPDLKVTGINHVVLHVSDVDRSVKFYMEVLGFESRNISVGSERKMSFLRCGIQGLDLFEVAGDVHGGEEMNHMALDVEADDLDEVIEKLEKAGIDASERTPRNSVFIHDPDGHQIEMLPRSAQERSRERNARASA